MLFTVENVEGDKRLPTEVPPVLKCDCMTTSRSDTSNDNRCENETNSISTCSNPNCPYAYLRRNSFTSEAFKIQLKNISRHAGFSVMKKMLQTLNVKFCKIKILKSGLAFISFGSAADRDFAITVLDGHTWKGSKMEAKIARPHADPLMKRRAETELNSELPSKEQHLDWLSEPIDLEKAHENLRDSILPLWRLRYDPDQLTEKRNLILKYLAETRERLSLSNPEVVNLDSVKYIEEYDSERRLTICKLAPIIPSPIQTEYRNKSELTIGYEVDGSGPVIGFRYSKYRRGSVAVGSFKSWNFLPKASSKVIDALQLFLTACSKGELDKLPKLIPFDPITYKGNWRHVFIRESRSENTLVVLYVNSSDFTEEVMNNLLNELRIWFQTGPGSDSGLTSLYLSTCSRAGVKQCDEDLHQVFGKPYIVEQCCGLKFHVSISAFFQVNTLAAELLFDRISYLCSLPLKYESTNQIACSDEIHNERERILLDVCCGTGTIGLCLAKHFHRVIGIDICNSAIEDAKLNAQLNDIQNVEFFAGKAEDMLRNVIQNLPKSCDLSVVVDPPRAGLHNSVIQILRNCIQIKRIIYISCNIEYAVGNFIYFAKPCSKKFTGLPFIPTMAEAVDLFPQTRHTEVILLLERIPSNS
ncbi:hypothetical protein MN116_004694 [Schistosoma mekongi]|uniref:tRNA (uracil(54)-C(5))-methyltransferase n=1 Tax=Schistosoma mekongi TaxID=38744 RepID=A0AAE2D4K6_SCHME|nr:hypothetical protein MN116_004694 [Schistosoma mekongi]